MPPEIVLTAIPFGAAFAASMLFGPAVIDLLKRRRVGQTISDDGPESHRTKAGTPTMGGLIILAGVLIGVLLIGWLIVGKGRESYGALSGSNAESLLAVVLLMAAYALLGMADDYLTIHPKGGIRGIASKPKAAAQILLAIAFVAWLSKTQWFSPILTIGGAPVLMGWTYWVFAVLFIAGMANFVNITDGLDGLVAGLSAIACVAFALMLLMQRQAATELTLIALLSALAGACLAFLWYNANPAAVFMGDTGSMAIGAALPAVAILTHREMMLIIIGLVFVLDGLSSGLQWAVFKFTRISSGTGRRVFKKSPVHHHFELSGWPEQKVVARFWIFGVLAAVVAYCGLAYRIW